jgi:ribosome biogenesis GTPase
MARRRLSQHQKNRIRAAQEVVSVSAEHPHGCVVSHQGGQVLVELDSNLTIRCKIKSNLGNIVCGDRVAIETSDNQEHRILAILPRDNLLQRIDGFKKVRAVASNISQLFICLSVTPEPNLFLLDQYLLSAEQQQIEACILLNKIDLCSEAGDPFGLAHIYQPLGYKMVTTSVNSGVGMDQFQALLPGQVSVLSGVSGVGKSSLTKWLLPGQEIKIASISEANEEGRHTTRASRLYHLPGGGDLIDTPGIRGFNPFIDSETPLAHGFREIFQHSEGCRFHNCLHLNEPGCAVIEAVAAETIANSRYKNYLKMLEQSGAD